jgi:hypothetical protein
MISLRIPNRSVHPADFRGRQGFCQNLNCMRPIEPPYRSASLCLPGGTLETILCDGCLPRPDGDAHPELRLEVVAAPVVLAAVDRRGPPSDAPLRLRPASELASTRPAPGPPGKCDGPPTFQQLVALEPRLLDLLVEALGHHENRERSFCANAVWCGHLGHRPGLKARLRHLAGWAAEQGGVLRTREAYDVAAGVIYRALPDCRRCPCG